MSQVPLALSNLLSRGFTMAEARKKLGLDKKPEAAPAPTAPGAKPAGPVRTNPAITPPPTASAAPAADDSSALL